MSIFSINMNNKKSNIHYQRLSLIKPFIWRLIAGFLVMIVTVAIQLIYPKAIAYFIDNSVNQKEGGWLTWMVFVMVVVFLFQAVATGLRFYLFDSTGSMIVTEIRRKLYGAIIRQEIGFFDKRNVGELTSRLASDVEVLQDTLTMGMAIALRSFFIVIGGMTMLLMLSLELSLLMLVIVPLTILSARWFGGKMVSRSKALQENLAQCGHVAQETFSNIRLVHAFTQEKKAQEKYNQATANALNFSIACSRIFASFQGLSSFIQAFALLIALWFGGKLIANQSLSIGELTSFILYTGMVATSSGALSSFWGEWMRSVGATERVFELINRIPRDLTRSSPDSFSLKGEIEFDKVSFAYPTRLEKTALKSINLKIAAGEKVALVGASGAGKSTIANLLLGFYHPINGGLKFDGVQAQNLRLADIRKSIAIVEQEPALFSGTIFENIQYAASDLNFKEEDIINAAKQANADDFIRGFPEGYNTKVGERGVQLSGGQKQRIAIARAILRDPKILILDEATSALDSESEHQVQTALKNLMQGRTTIMIAHRYSTIAKAERLIVLENGEIVQDGTHDQLIQEQSGLYHRLMEKQMTYEKMSESVV